MASIFDSLDSIASDLCNLDAELGSLPDAGIAVLPMDLILPLPDDLHSPQAAPATAGMPVASSELTSSSDRLVEALPSELAGMWDGWPDVMPENDVTGGTTPSLPQLSEMRPTAATGGVPHSSDACAAGGSSAAERMAHGSGSRPGLPSEDHTGGGRSVAQGVQGTGGRRDVSSDGLVGRGASAARASQDSGARPDLSSRLAAVLSDLASAKQRQLSAGIGRSMAHDDRAVTAHRTVSAGRDCAQRDCCHHHYHSSVSSPRQQRRCNAAVQCSCGKLHDLFSENHWHERDGDGRGSGEEGDHLNRSSSACERCSFGISHHHHPTCDAYNRENIGVARSCTALCCCRSDAPDHSLLHRSSHAGNRNDAVTLLSAASRVHGACRVPLGLQGSGKRRQPEAAGAVAWHGRQRAVRCHGSSLQPSHGAAAPAAECPWKEEWEEEGEEGEGEEDEEGERERMPSSRLASGRAEEGILALLADDSPVSFSDKAGTRFLALARSSSGRFPPLTGWASGDHPTGGASPSFTSTLPLPHPSPLLHLDLSSFVPGNGGVGMSGSVAASAATSAMTARDRVLHKRLTAMAEAMAAGDKVRGVDAQNWR